MAKKKRPRDTNRLAKSIVDQATSEEPEEEESPKVTAGRKGGQKGGKARADSLTAEERSAIARKAAAARWNRPSS
jgi:hypothetical protein